MSLAAHAVTAAGTPVGTIIRNVAVANYEDTGGNPLPPVESNEGRVL